VLTAGSFLYWLSVLVADWPNRRFVIRHLEMSEMPFDAEKNAQAVEHFVGKYLRADGMFVIRMLTLHSGVIFGTELVVALWQSYYGIEASDGMKRSNSDGNLYTSDSLSDLNASLLGLNVQHHTETNHKRIWPRGLVALNRSGDRLEPPIGLGNDLTAKLIAAPEPKIEEKRPLKDGNRSATASRRSSVEGGGGLTMGSPAVRRKEDRASAAGSRQSNRGAS